MDESDVEQEFMVQPVRRRGPTLVPKRDQLKGNNLAWFDLCYTIPMKEGPPKVIVDNVSGVAEAGRITAMMGPSGAGKSTLLDVLADRVSSGVVGGTVTMNGVPRAPHFKREFAYVTQTDAALYPHFTVYENLYYSAELRLSASLTPEQRVARVNEVIDSLGLRGVANTLIGNDLVRGVSGGERRRTSIAMELIPNPSVIFLDEPTSGLDSKAAYTILHALKRLAVDGNKTVIMAIHQPSSELYSLLDDILLISGGKLVYYGPGEAALPFFERNGHPIHEHVNPADHYMSIINYDFESEQQPDGAVAPHVQQLVDSFASSDYMDAIIERMEVHPEAITLGPRRANKYETSWFRQCGVLIRRNFRMILKTPAMFRARLVSYMFMALLMGGTFWQLDHDQLGIQNRAAALFYSTAFIAILSITATHVFLEERVIYFHQRLNSYFHVGAYALAMFVTMIPFHIIIGTLFSSVVYFMIGFQAAQFGYFVATLSVVIMTSDALVMVIASLISVNIVATTASSALMGVFMITCGFFIPRADIPDWFIWFHWLAFHTYAFEALMSREFCCDIQFPCDTEAETPCWCIRPDENDGNCIVSGQEVINSYGFEHIEAWQWLLVMLCMTCIYRVLFYLILRFKHQGRH